MGSFCVPSRHHFCTFSPLGEGLIHFNFSASNTTFVQFPSFSVLSTPESPFSEFFVGFSNPFKHFTKCLGDYANEESHKKKEKEKKVACLLPSLYLYYDDGVVTCVEMEIKGENKTR